MKRAALVLTLALGACSGAGRERQLQARLAMLEAERARLTEAAMNLLSTRRETAKLEAELAVAQESSLNAGYFHEGITSTGEKASVTWDGTDRAAIAGKGGSAASLAMLERAMTRVPAAGISGLSIASGGTWSASFFRILPDAQAHASPAPAATPEGIAIPPPGSFESTHTAHLRQRIAALERELVELRKIADEEEALEARRASLEAEVQSLERADRVVNAFFVFDLFLDPHKCGVKQGEITFDRDRVRVKGTLSSAAPIDMLRVILEKHFSVTDRGATPPAIDLELARLSAN